MKHTKSIMLTGLAVLLSLGMLVFNSCEKLFMKDYTLKITNNFDFDVKLNIENERFDKSKNPYSLPAGHYNFYTSKNAGQSMSVKAYNKKTGSMVGSISFQGESEGSYSWVVGANSVIDRETGKPISGGGSGSGGSGSGGSGGSGGGDCPGAEAERYKDLLTNSPSNSCSQIWAQQAVWHAYKCNCDRGMASASDANKMVATLNATRTAIENLYKSGGSGPYTKCGSIPPKVTKCKLQ